MLAEGPASHPDAVIAHGQAPGCKHIPAPNHGSPQDYQRRTTAVAVVVPFNLERLENPDGVLAPFVRGNGFDSKAIYFEIKDFSPSRKVWILNIEMHDFLNTIYRCLSHIAP